MFDRIRRKQRNRGGEKRIRGCVNARVRVYSCASRVKERKGGGRRGEGRERELIASVNHPLTRRVGA